MPTKARAHIKKVSVRLSQREVRKNRNGNKEPIKKNKFSWADPEGGGRLDTLEKSQKYRVSSQYWSGSLKNHKATKPAFNVGPSSARQ